MFVPLFLLICFFSPGQLQTQSDKDLIPQGKQTESLGKEPANASYQQQTSLQDIHAVLRQMSALLGEQRAEIRHLQRENEGTVACVLRISTLLQVFIIKKKSTVVFM